MTFQIEQLTERQRNLLCLTGRVEDYIKYPERKTFPVSCTNYVYNNDLDDCLKYLSKALRGGAGINVNLKGFTAPNKPLITQQWEFNIDKSHKDYNPSFSLPSTSLIDASKDYIKILKVADSMEESERGYVSIEESWTLFYDYLVNGYSVYLDLSKLRPSGTTNAKGLTASGPYIFLSFYDALYEYYENPSLTTFIKLLGTLNDTIRRGGAYKNGIITFSYPWNGYYVDEYLNLPLEDIPGSGKKKLHLTKDILNKKSDEYFDMLANKVNKNDIMLTKERYDKKGDLLEVNVCQGIYFKERGTCLLNHVNLGKCETPKDIIEAFTIGMEILIDLHFKWERPSQYSSAEDDRQVALGVVGLANFLSIHNITYYDFTIALMGRVNGLEVKDIETQQWVDALIDGYIKAAEIAKKHGLERAFTIEPTQSCAFRHTDSYGYTVCRNIYPPHHNKEKRTSHTVKDLAKVYNHGLVETMPEIVEQGKLLGINIIQVLCESWQKMMDLTGLSHCISYDIYEPITGTWIKDFIENSPLWTTYYVRTSEIDMSIMDKGLSCTSLKKEECTACSE